MKCPVCKDGVLKLIEYVPIKKKHNLYFTKAKATMVCDKCNHKESF